MRVRRSDLWRGRGASEAWPKREHGNRSLVCSWTRYRSHTLPVRSGASPWKIQGIMKIFSISSRAVLSLLTSRLIQVLRIWIVWAQQINKSSPLSNMNSNCHLTTNRPTRHVSPLLRTTSSSLQLVFQDRISSSSHKTWLPLWQLRHCTYWARVMVGKDSCPS